MVPFSINQSINQLARTRNSLCDGTFCITPYLWHQVFIVIAEFCEKSFVPVAFGLFPDKKGETCQHNP